jgi:crossover junction endodeoxyribonuclease RusA
LPVSVEFKLHPKTTKTGEASKTRMDLDNVIKVLLDALNGVAYMDDKQVVRLVGEVSYPVPGGGLSVRVTA